MQARAGSECIVGTGENIIVELENTEVAATWVLGNFCEWLIGRSSKDDTTCNEYARQPPCWFTLGLDFCKDGQAKSTGIPREASVVKGGLLAVRALDLVIISYCMLRVVVSTIAHLTPVQARLGH